MTFIKRCSQRLLAYRHFNEQQETQELRRQIMAQS